MTKEKKSEAQDAKMASLQPLDGESAERFAERIDIEAKLEASSQEASVAYEALGKAAFELACEDDDFAAKLGDAFVVAKEQLADRQAMIDRLSQLEAKRLAKLESRKKYEQAEAAAKELDEEAKRLEEEARQAKEEAERLAREAQERADQLNAMLEEGRRKHEEALREAEQARAAAETTMLFDFVQNDDAANQDDAAQEADTQVAEDVASFVTPEPEVAAEQPASAPFNPGETVAMSEMAAPVVQSAPTAPADPSVPGDGVPASESAISDQPTAFMPLVASNVCPNCGSSVGAEDRFCMECGTALQQAPSAAPSAAPAMCPNCGNLRQEGDAFCMMCGTKF